MKILLAVYSLIGFGYDSSLDDYNFIRVDNITRNTHIFSIQSNSGRTIVDASDKYSIKPKEHVTDNLGFAVDR